MAVTRERPYRCFSYLAVACCRSPSMDMQAALHLLQESTAAEVLPVPRRSSPTREDKSFLADSCIYRSHTYHLPVQASSLVPPPEHFYLLNSI